MTKAVWSGVAAAMIVAATAAACGGGGGSTPTSPTTGGGTSGGGTSGGGNSSTATITIGTDGRVSPASVTIPVGGRITFVNNHSRAHDMQSDPHPEHTDCPPMAAVGFLSPGQSRTSSNFNTARTCGFHDHNEDTNTALQGRIIIQ